MKLWQPLLLCVPTCNIEVLHVYTLLVTGQHRIPGTTAVPWGHKRQYRLDERRAHRQQLQRPRQLLTVPAQQGVHREGI